MKKIIILGYMGSGKTTIAKMLSKRLNFVCQDLDENIEINLGLSVKNIFKQKGEIFFRKVENQLLKRLLQTEENMIISLGGGAPCYSDNMELLAEEKTVSIYLKTSIENLFVRLQNQKENRPLLANKNEAEMKEFIAKHLFERSYYYNQATHTINTDGKSPEEVTREIRRILV